MIPEQKRINFSRRDFLKLAAVSPLALFPREPDDPWTKEKEPATRPTLALYIPFHYLAYEKYLKPFKKLLLGSGANTVVIDIKNEYGYINIPVEHDLLPKTAIIPGYIEALADMMAWAKANDISLIARQVVMLDTALVESHRHLGLKGSGGPWQDSFGNYWANPYDEQVVAYNAAITRAAVAFGLTKIQRDYVRFPAGDPGLKNIIYSKRNTEQNRVDAITAFFKATYPLVRRYGAILTADFFGYTAWKEQKDMGIGQSIESAGRYLSGISPMAYPGLYGSGIPGCPDGCRPPTAHPYEIVYETVALTLERLKRVNPKGFVEPWIQAYPDNRFKQPMGLKQFQQQQDAAFAAGATGVMAWDPSLRYHPDFYQG